MSLLQIYYNNFELVSAIALAAFFAGFIRGFAGFGGPAFMLATLSLFYPPITILSKIFIVDYCSGLYLIASIWRKINWRLTAAISIPTMVSMPVGQWLLIQTDPLVMSQVIGIIIGICSLFLLLGLRYKKPLTTSSMIFLGLISGVVFGATYIALVVVAAMLLGPYTKDETRGLIIAWSFIVSCWYAVISIYSGSTQFHDIYIAFPGIILYLAGTWLGTRFFRESTEGLYRKVALIILLVLSSLSLLK